MTSVGPLELIIILAIIAIVVVLPVVLIVAIAGRIRPSVVVAPPARDPALDALRSRLAAGEIDEAEYQRLRATLQAS
jgi:uncharacterized membrane protein